MAVNPYGKSSTCRYSFARSRDQANSSLFADPTLRPNVPTPRAAIRDPTLPISLPDCHGSSSMRFLPTVGKPTVRRPDKRPCDVAPCSFQIVTNRAGVPLHAAVALALRR